MPAVFVHLEIGIAATEADFSNEWRPSARPASVTLANCDSHRHK
jgi:hypothetical protein